MTKACASEEGYTLVELLVALTLFSALAIIMMAGYQLVTTTWLRLDATSGSAIERETAEDTIRAQLSHAYPGYLGNQPGAKTIAFTGHADSVEFLAPLPDRFGAPALVWYTIRSGTDGVLHMAWRFDRGDSSDTILMSGIRSASFAYFGKDAAGGDAHWANEWVGRKELPNLVRLHLDRDDGTSQNWPDLIVAPQLTASAECVFDQADGQCRG